LLSQVLSELRLLTLALVAGLAACAGQPQSSMPSMPSLPPVNNMQPNRLNIPLPPPRKGFAGSGKFAPMAMLPSTQRPPAARWQFPFKPNPFTKPVCASDPCSPKLDRNSDKIVTHLQTTTCAGVPCGFSLGFISVCQPGTDCPGEDGTWPTYYPSATDPQYQITCTYKSSCSVPANLQIPDGAVASGSDDHHAIVIVMTSRTTGSQYNFFKFPTVAVHGGGPLTVASVSSCTISSFAGTGTCTSGGNAAGLPEQGALLDPREILAGSINHVLSGPMNCPSPNHVWPAHSSDGVCPGGIKQGQRVWLDLTDAQIDALPAPHAAWDKTILKALHHYGMVANDSMQNNPNAPWSFSGFDNMTLTLGGGQPAWPAFFTEVQNECPTCDMGWVNGTSHLDIPTTGISPSNLHIVK